MVNHHHCHHCHRCLSSLPPLSVTTVCHHCQHGHPATVTIVTLAPPSPRSPWRPQKKKVIRIFFFIGKPGKQKANSHYHFSITLFNRAKQVFSQGKKILFKSPTVKKDKFTQ
jgi:hypothetical protein